MTLLEPQYITDLKTEARKAVIDLEIALPNRLHPAFQGIAAKAYRTVELLANELDISHADALRMVSVGR